jgi:hypothetical protein
MDKRQKIAVFRERFFGRQDIYGRQWHSVKEDGKEIKGFAPVCTGFWGNSCHLKLKDGVTCARCEVKEYTPVSDESVWKHIIGEEKQIQYLVQDNGTIKFAACDFDMKAGKESQGYTFEDVKIVSRVLMEEGIPHAIARSTTAGYHLYFFFKEFYSAYKFRTVAYWICERVGFTEQMRQGIRPLFEIFPRQSYTGGFGIGNGICCSTIEPQWAKGRNGFVDAEDTFIAPEHQWEYLASIPFIETAAFDAIIEKHGIEIDATRRTLSRNFASTRGKWQQPLTGSFEKVIEGCTAIRRVFEKAAKGVVPGHQEGFAAFHLSMQCVDGIEVFKNKMEGWGKTDKDWDQLQHSIDKSYAPWTCKKMQENGVCVAGTKCFERKPPLILVEGHYVSQTDIPEAEWPEAGPIRYAYGKGDDFLDKLKKEVDDLQGELDENVKGNALRNIAKRAQVFDEDQQRALREHIKNKKVIKANDLSKMFNKATGEYAKDIKEKATSRSDVVYIGKNTYQLCNSPCGYSMMKVTKDGPSWDRISNCFLDIEEERSYLDDDVVVKSVYKGRLVSDKMNAPFEISQDEWWDNNKFFAFFGKAGTANFNVIRDDINYIRQASIAFSERRGIQKHNHLVTQGWYQSTYLMPTVLVDADGIRPNTEKEIDLTTKHHAAFLDFKILSDEDFRLVGFHLMTDFINAWPRKWTFICLAHALLPAMVAPLSLRKKPTLFLEGLTGSGKTELLHTTQYFWGEFESIVNMASTAKGLMAVAHDFKDTLLVFDDYKGLNQVQTNALQNVIQYSYDPNASVKLSRDSTLRKPTLTRGVIAFTGEHFLENDSAMVARTILLEVDKQDTSKTKDRYSKCIEYRHLYNGITPRFIHWFLHQDHAAAREDLGKIHRLLHEPNSAMQNSDRISYNCALNHLIWKIFIKFMAEHGFVQNEDALVKEHMVYIKEVQGHMSSRCNDDQNGMVFLRVLVQLITSGDVVIQGFNDREGDTHRPVIGFVSKDAYGPQLVNILPDTAARVVRNSTKDSQIRGTVQEFSRQFAHGGYLVDADPQRFKKQVRWNGGRVYVWPFDMGKLGMFFGSGEADEAEDNRLKIIKGGKTACTPKIVEHENPVFHSDGTF